MRSPSLRRNDGFTLIELMVVVLIIAVLIAIAVPTFAGFRRRGQDEAAKSNLKTAELTARLVEIDLETIPNNATLLALLPTMQPSIAWLDHTDPSTTNTEVSIDEDGNTELNMAARSDSGACFYVRVVLDAPSERMVDPAAATCEAHDYVGGPDTGW